eukprot:scaffold43695_cov48-Prasinocladus_malaysianus.AAC.1
MGTCDLIIPNVKFSCVFDGGATQYKDIWTNKSALCCVSSVDLLILSAVIVNPMREDCRRRGWRASKATPFCLLPVVGPALYLLLRPRLND